MGPVSQPVWTSFQDGSVPGVKVKAPRPLMTSASTAQNVTSTTFGRKATAQASQSFMAGDLTLRGEQCPSIAKAVGNGKGQPFLLLLFLKGGLF